MAMAMAMAVSVKAAGPASPIGVSGVGESHLGIYIADIATGEALRDINSNAAFVPASITKALTSASVLTLMNSYDRYETRVEAVGKITDDGTLKGDIVVRCVGDPTVESAYFDEAGGFADSIAAAVVATGIKRVEGTVVIDSSLMPEEGVPDGWADEDIVWPYGTSHHAANFRDNKFVLTLPSRKSVPYVPGLQVSHTPAKGSLKIDRKKDSNVIISRGNPRRNGESITVSTPDPSAVMRHEVMQKLRHNGVEMSDAPVSADGDDVASTLYIHRSPELVDILRSLMYRSDNMMAEAMLRSVAPGQSRASAVKTELDMWETRDVDTRRVVIEDGSGLSRNDRLTPMFLANVFTWMASHYKAPDYVSLFPKAGCDGTLKSFLRDTPLEGRVALKTGSMRGVQSYAGYMLGGDGQPTHVIVIMVNGFTCGRTALKTGIEDMLLSMFAPDYVRPVKQVTKAPKKKGGASRTKSQKSRKSSKKKRRV